MSLITFLTFFSGLSFIVFGISCLFTSQMKTEFIRYGLDNYRKLVGVLQVIGAVGLLFGYYLSQPLQILAAAGLAILMLAGFIVRLKIRDSFLQSAPSLIYAVVNLMICLILLDLIRIA